MVCILNFDYMFDVEIGQEMLDICCMYVYIYIGIF